MTVRERRRAPPELTGKRASITVGVHGTEGGELHDGATFADDGALELPSDLTVADVASFHEFGTRNVPQRSFIRGWFDEQIDVNRELLRTALTEVVSGKRPLQQALERVALKMEANVKRRIRNRIPPPLKPETIARKGSSVPLIDTGQLRASIRAKVSLE